MNMRKFNRKKNAENFIGLSHFSRVAGYLVFYFANRSDRLSTKLQLVGDVSNYSDWIKFQLGNPRRFFYREGLIKCLIDKHLQDGSIVLEFGVAKGYLTRWVLNLDFNHRIKVWHGFDTFEGLPNPWRNYQVGAFSNNGETPKINDSRILWHVGLAEACIKFVSYDDLQKTPLLIIFDLDLEQPTRDVLEYLLPAIKKNDILYFDEAYDIGERRVIMDHIIDNFQFVVIGVTPLAIAFKILNIKA